MVGARNKPHRSYIYTFKKQRGELEEEEYTKTNNNYNKYPYDLPREKIIDERISYLSNALAHALILSLFSRLVFSTG